MSNSRMFLRRGVLILVAASALVSAAEATCGASSCNGERVLMIYTNANGDVYVQVTGDMTNLNCSLVSGVFVTLKATDARFKEIYATMLANQIADRPMTFRINDGSAGCTIQYVTSP